jgi:hypothetical protein
MAAPPRTNDFFEYDYSTTVDQGQLDYSGYTESLHGHYRYAVLSVTGDTVTVHGEGSYTYESSLTGTQTGTESYNPVFSMRTRAYLSGIDVNVSDPASASVWFWIATPVTLGQSIQVLDEPLTVRSLSDTVWIGAVPHSAILAAGSGTYTRDDAYGRLTATYDDKYWFDRDSGFIVAEQYTEQDANATAAFHYAAQVSVTASSYAIPLDLVSFSLLYVGVPALVVVIVAGIIRVRRGPSRLRIGSGNQATYVRIRKAKTPADATGLIPDGSPFFGPFLPIFAERSIAEGDPVVLALDARKIVGMALLDRESGMGSLFASEDPVARALIKRVRMVDFFADATIPGRLLRAKEIDRFTILQLRNPRPLDYDAGVVRPMTAEDLPMVTRIAQEVYRSNAARFIESSFKAGDLGFVATSGGAVVGFGFAMVVGTVARLHTLTVAATERARGLGTEITNARLSTLAALGVDRVIVEISRQNAASLRVAAKAGFAPVGESVYYSRNPPSAPSALQRQT